MYACWLFIHTLCLIIPRILHISSVTRTMKNLVLKVVCLLSLVPAGTCEPLQSNTGERPSCYNAGASQKQTSESSIFFLWPPPTLSTCSLFFLKQTTETSIIFPGVVIETKNSLQPSLFVCLEAGHEEILLPALFLGGRNGAQSPNANVTSQVSWLSWVC